MATLTAGGLLLAGGVAGLVYSFDTYNKTQAQQKLEPQDRPIGREQFLTLSWLYPASWAAVALGTAGVAVGTVWSLKGVKGEVGVVGVVPTQGGLILPVAGTF